MQGEDAARHERPIPRNKRLKQDDDDDAPTYVLEDTNQSMTKEEYEAFVAKKDSNKDSTEQEDTTNEPGKDEDPKSKDKITEIGANVKKRKAAKIIGDEQDVGKDQPSKDAGEGTKKPTKKPKKKAKAVKLTFGDEEEG